MTPPFTLADLHNRCPRSDLPAPSCAHCREDVQATLDADPEFAQYLADLDRV